MTFQQKPQRMLDMAVAVGPQIYRLLRERIIRNDLEPGARISAVAGHASTMALLPQIRHAQVILNDIPDDTFALVRDGKAEAIAMPREILDAYLPQWPEAKILDDRFGVNNVGVGMAKGQPELLAQISAFIEEAKASGMIATVIAGADMPFFKVAPPAAQ